MSTRRATLALALIAMAAITLWVATLPQSESARISALVFVPLPVIGAGVLFVWRTVGSLLALVAGIVGLAFGGALSFVAGFSGNQTDPAIAALAYLGLGVAAFALIDLAALILSRRSANG